MTWIESKSSTKVPEPSISSGGASLSFHGLLSPPGGAEVGSDKNFRNVLIVQISFIMEKDIFIPGEIVYINHNNDVDSNLLDGTHYVADIRESLT